MDLFGHAVINLLPCDGEAVYYGPVLGQQQAQQYLHQLMATIPWRQDEVWMFGKRIVTQRKMAWYGDKGFAYTYSGSTHHALPWTEQLRQLKQLAEEQTDALYNSCLLNLYHNGSEGMSWHSDNEKTLVPEAAIASISLGAERKFAFKHKSQPLSASVMLQNGSLLLMQGATQTHWLHSLPKTTKVNQPRINLTFRQMLPQG
jgi:alkylated DNA repair dioxygenase AlkB